MPCQTQQHALSTMRAATPICDAAIVYAVRDAIAAKLPPLPRDVTRAAKCACLICHACSRVCHAAARSRAAAYHTMLPACCAARQQPLRVAQQPRVLSVKPAQPERTFVAVAACALACSVDTRLCAAAPREARRGAAVRVQHAPPPPPLFSAFSHAIFHISEFIFRMFIER